jgi:transposase InsO family protein
VIKLVAEAVKAGARQRLACEEVGIDERTLQRWKNSSVDGRSTHSPAPSNRLSDAEQERALAVMNSREFRDLSPKQIVPKLAERGEYIASESTMYRLLEARGQLKHRAPSRPPTPRRLREHVATGPNQVWSWDITYLRSPIRGAFFYLYLAVDVWSRKIVGWTVQDRECHTLAADFIATAAQDEGVDQAGLVLHSDNGGPMKGATMLATLRGLGITASFNRPSVSNDNPFSEAIFRTLKYRPNFPTKPFASLADARSWVGGFVRWYNTEHMHSGIRYVTPQDRHTGRDVELLAQRHALYQTARRRNPARWSGDTRDWSHIKTVTLNPEAGPRTTKKKRAA